MLTDTNSRWRINSIAVVMALVLHAQSLAGTASPEYRFLNGPYPEGGGDGPTDASACTDATQPWYGNPSEACQGLKGILPSCDRRSAVYRNYVATLNSSGTCSVSWEFQNVGSSGWGSWGSTWGVQTRCPSGSRLSGGVCVELNAEDRTQTARNSPCFSNPVFPLTGAKKEFVSTGLSLAGVPWTLTYDTTPKLPANQTDTATLTEMAPLGPLWKSSFHRQLQVSAGRNSALISRGDGTILNFHGDGTGNFTSTGDHPHKLVAVNGGGYRFIDTRTANIETYDATGKLQTIETVGQGVLTFTYRVATLVKVSDSAGRSIQFTYNANDLITRIVGPAGFAIVLAYDTNRNLTALTWPDGKSQGFLYENSALPWALTGKLDENGSRFATFTYDSQGRALVSEHAGGADRYEFAYPTPALRTVVDSVDATGQAWSRTSTWTVPQGITVTKPNGQAALLDAQVVAGSPALTAQSQPAGSGCPASANSATYDANGNVLSRDDFQGARTCYAYDSENREIVRLEGLSTSAVCSALLPAGTPLPSGARRIATTWHPDWMLPTQVTEPLRQTTTIYQGLPDPSNGNALANCTTAPARSDGKPMPLVCKVVEQALLASGAADASAPPRVTTYSYDSSGRPLTQVDPRGGTTALSYYDTSSFVGEEDPYAANVSLLLHGEPCASCLTITDSSANAFAPSSAAGVSVVTTDSRLGSGAINIASGQTLSYTGKSAFLMTGDFTFEAFLKVSNANNMTLLMLRESEAPGRTIFFTSSTGVITYNRYGANNQVFSGSTTAIPLNTWFHIAFSRTGSTIRCFINGVLLGSVTDGATLGNGVGGLWMVAGGTSTDALWDEIRVTKGAGRYTSNFPVPTQQFGNPLQVGHFVGDLRASTNVGGQVTEFTDYDRAGRLKRSIDPKSVVNEIDYTPRGQVKTATTTPPGGGARQTSYTYDGIGQLATVVAPDGGTTSYTYDAAHRLTAVTDARGNMITYTLDASGNRVGEDTRDPGGLLRRSVARSFDALGHVQQVTGPAGSIGGGSSGDPDPAAANVSLLLHGEPCLGCPIVADSSPNAFTPSSTTGTSFISADSKFGSHSIRISGGQALTYTGKSAFLMSGDFTFEAFLKVSNASGMTLLLLRETEAPGRAYFFTSSTGVVTYNRYGANNQVFNSSTTAIPLNTWFHIAFSRNGATIRCFINGVLLGSVTDSATLGNGVGGMLIGAGGSSTDALWDEVRVTKGVGRYTSNFAVPTQQFASAYTDEVGGIQYSASHKEAAFALVGTVPSARLGRSLGAGIASLASDEASVLSRCCSAVLARGRAGEEE